MDAAALRAARLRSHRLSAPAGTIAATAGHMLATQAQEFWGGRWALAARTRGEPSLSDVDRAFDRGQIVRAWTMRGTLHIIPAQDLAWVLSVTTQRQQRQSAPIHRGLGIEPEHLSTAERLVRVALAGGNRITRQEFAGFLDGAGLATAGMRANHMLSALAIRGVIVFGPVIARTEAPSRDQYLVLAEDAVAGSATPSDPLAEFFVRFIASHGPAGPADFAWWAGLPLGTARDARDRAGARVRQVDDDDQYVSADPAPRRSADAPRVRALPPFEEYYLSYADRTTACPPELAAVIGPSMNGLVRPILVADGEIIGTWSHSVAVGKHARAPVPEVLARDSAAASEIDAALAMFSRFLTR